MKLALVPLRPRPMLEDQLAVVQEEEIRATRDPYQGDHQVEASCARFVVGIAGCRNGLTQSGDSRTNLRIIEHHVPGELVNVFDYIDCERVGHP